MQVYRRHSDLPADARGASAAIGNFDGVHLGHRKVLDLARGAAETARAPLGVVTFEPHPRAYFDPDAPPFRLMNAETRAHRLERLGVARLYELPFGEALVKLTPRAFAAEILRDGLGLSHAVIGADFRFGNKRAGTAPMLAEFGAEMGFGVTVAELLKEEGRDVSSTRIREALSAGDAPLAAAMLGHLHRIDGPVIEGARRGRDLGYPTANMSLEGLHLPRFGVYAVAVDVLTGPRAGSFGGVASLGVRPMFGENAPNLETYLFDFAGDLYGEHLSVGLVAFLRGEARFDSVAGLVAQMDRDAAQAREILAGRIPA